MLPHGVTNCTRDSQKASPKITLYTNHGCPYAHRAHITLDELQLPYEEVFIDLDTPRPQWYLDLNPRGLVPTIKYSVPDALNEVTITESAVVSQFLCDNFPSPLLPASHESPAAALRRARIAFFTDTWTTKVTPVQLAIMRLDSQQEQEAKAKELTAIIEKDIEPLLKDADPFFGGSRELTFAEVMTAPFVLRWMATAEQSDIVPKGHLAELQELPNFGKWAKAVIEHPSVTRIFDKESFLQRSHMMKTKFKQMEAKKQNPAAV